MARKTQFSFLMTETSWSYRFVLWFFIIVKKVFFRDVIIRGSHKIPKNGSIIFVAAPHCNQFVDPIILISSSTRSIGFLMAAVSLKRKIVGFFGRMLDSIPVDRAQDYAKKCSGNISLSSINENNLTLIGEGTFFLSEIASQKQKFSNQAAIMISYQKENFCAPIDIILNDTEIILKKPFDQKINIALKSEKFSFSVVPLIDQSSLYTSVFERLSKNNCIGIFPEGGSHDRAEMLPLKAGVSVMTLGYLSLYPEADLKIIPCGLNYFNAHKFRSRAVIEFGDPLDVPSDLVADFKLGDEKKRLAIEKHLKSLADALKTVTVNVPDLETLQIIQAARRLYRPEETHKKPDLQIELNRRFVKGYIKYRDDPRIIQLRKSIADYNNLLLAFGIKDHQVKNTQIDAITLILQLSFHLSVLIVFGLISLPGFVVNSPALYLIGRISKRKAAAAKKASSVKIHGKDVISTWKLLVALVLLPLLYGFYSIIIIWFSSALKSETIINLTVTFILIFNTLVIVSYGTIRLSEMVYASYNSIKPLILTILNPERYMILRQVRSTLHEQINLVVDELGPTVVDDFDRNRIIKSPNYSNPGRYSPVLSYDFINAQDMNYSMSSLSVDFGSGRASPIFDTNMETIETMLNQCKELLKKRKLE